MGGGSGEGKAFDGTSMNIMKSSTFGSNVSSRRRTAPAFGFGAATREVANKVFVSQEHNMVSTAGLVSPGPAQYNLPAAVGGKQPDAARSNAPVWEFGKDPRFRPSSAPHVSPGPASYTHVPGIGGQVVAGFRTAPQPRFGSASRQQARKVFVSQEHQATDLHGVDTPGPAVYDIKSAVGGKHPATASKPVWVFGTGAARVDRIGDRSPGPCAYTLTPCITKKEERPPRGFGHAFDRHGRRGVQAHYMGREFEADYHGKQSPGPAALYYHTPAVGRQISSAISTSPRATFTRADRWAEFNRELKKNSTPGPGAY